MIRMLSFGFLLITCPKITTAQNELDMIREKFHEADEKNDLKSIINLEVQDRESENWITCAAYKAVATAMMAQYLFSPFSKYKHFKRGVGLLEESIQERKSVEVVYLRLLVQLNAPKILGYHKNIEEDLDFFKQHISQSGLGINTKRLFINSLIKTKNKHYDLNSLKTLEIQ